MTPPAHTHGGEGHSHRTPRDCPVCGERLVIHALGCEHCGTELSGSFQPCAYCGLPAEDLETLRVFLVSRGNMRELERHLGVSYPTARQRFAGVDEAESLLAGIRTSSPEG